MFAPPIGAGSASLNDVSINLPPTELPKGRPRRRRPTAMKLSARCIGSMNWKYASVGVLPGITLDSCEAQQKSQSTDVRVAVIQLACAVGAGELFPGHV